MGIPFPIYPASSLSLSQPVILVTNDPGQAKGGRKAPSHDVDSIITGVCVPELLLPKGGSCNNTHNNSVATASTGRGLCICSGGKGEGGR